MKTQIFICLLAAGAFAFWPGTIYAQGALTPSGPPAPTMKTLDQIEPRTALAGGFPNITSPGSYYLTKNVDRIHIQSDNVTLDLNGFSVITTNDSEGIWIAPGINRGNITIRNGSLIGLGKWTRSGEPWQGTFAGSAQVGISATRGFSGVSPARDVRIESITIRGFFVGIDLPGNNEFDGRRSQIRHCAIFDCGIGIQAYNANLQDVSVQTCAYFGIQGDLCNYENMHVERCGEQGMLGGGNTYRGVVIRFCGRNGLQATDSILNDIVVSGADIGIACDNSTLDRVNASLNRKHGIGGSGNTIANAVCRANAGSGLEVTNSTMKNITVINNTGTGIVGSNVGIDGAVIDGNQGHGIFGPGSIIRGVRASNNRYSGIRCDESTINECVISTSGMEGIRGVNSSINNCRSSNNDTDKTDNYTAPDIYWLGGRQQGNVAGSYEPAAPGP